MHGCDCIVSSLLVKEAFEVADLLQAGGRVCEDSDGTVLCPPEKKSLKRDAPPLQVTIFFPVLPEIQPLGMPGKVNSNANPCLW